MKSKILRMKQNQVILNKTIINDILTHILTRLPLFELHVHFVKYTITSVSALVFTEATVTEVRS